jgi:hypothetical protein
VAEKVLGEYEKEKEVGEGEEQEVMGRTNRLVSFDTTRTA